MSLRAARLLLQRAAPVGAHAWRRGSPALALKSAQSLRRLSDRGAPRQPVHPDTGFTPQTALLTAFVALQEVTPDLGPTFFLAGTHTRAAHERFNGEPGEKLQLLRSSPRRIGTLPAGAATLFDSRLLHAGGASVFRRTARPCMMSTAPSLRTSKPNDSPVPRCPHAALTYRTAGAPDGSTVAPTARPSAVV